MALDLSNTARELIRNLAGKSEDGLFFIEKETGGNEDPNTGQWIPGTVEQIPINGALVGYNQELINNETVRADDYKFITDYQTPWSNGDAVIIYGKRYLVVNPYPINHAGKLQVFIMQVRSS